MYALIVDGARQLKVEEGQELAIDYRRGLSRGQQITFDRVLATSGEGGAKVGRPALAGATVTAEVIGTTQGPKLAVQKLRRRKTLRRKTGHRQLYTKVRISSINVS